MSLTLFAACGDNVLSVPGEPQVLEPADPAAYEPRAVLPCGTFPLSGLDVRTGAEDMKGPEFDALRRAIQSSPEGYGDNTWRLVDREPERAMFVAQLESAWACIVVSQRAGGWTEEDEAEASEVNVALSEHVGPARWMLAAGPPPAESRELHVLVQEQACASGSYATARIAPPLIKTSADSLTITFGVRPFQSVLSVTCPSNPWTPAILVLSEPVGDRVLIDAGVYPPANRTQEQ